MRNALIFAGVMLVGLVALFVGRPETSEPQQVPVSPAAAPVELNAQPHPSTTSSASSSRPIPPAPSSTAPSAAHLDHGHLEEGVEEGGFDPSAPPAGAPSPEELKVAFEQAIAYVMSINSYGFGDQSINDFIFRSRPLMTSSLYEEWNDIAQMSLEAGTDDTLWAEYQTTRTRHQAAVGEPIVTAWAATELTLSIPYRTADVAEGQPVPSSASQRYARLWLVRSDTTWLVQRAAADS